MVETILGALFSVWFIGLIAWILFEEVIIGFLKFLAPVVAKKRTAKQKLAQKEKRKALAQATAGTELLGKIMTDTRAVLPLELENEVKIHLGTYPPQPLPLKKRKKGRK